MNSSKGVMFIFQNIIVTVARKQTSTSQFAPHTLETVFRRCRLKGMRFEIQSIIQRYLFIATNFCASDITTITNHAHMYSIVLNFEIY